MCAQAVAAELVAKLCRTMLFAVPMKWKQIGTIASPSFLRRRWYLCSIGLEAVCRSKAEAPIASIILVVPLVRTKILVEYVSSNLLDPLLVLVRSSRKRAKARILVQC